MMNQGNNPQGTLQEWKVKINTLLGTEKLVEVENICVMKGTDKQAESNAQLIAEAGTIMNKTGKTPNQLLSDNEQLVQALKEAKKELMNHVLALKNSDIFYTINTAISEAEVLMETKS